MHGNIIWIFQIPYSQAAVAQTTVRKASAITQMKKLSILLKLAAERTKEKYLNLPDFIKNGEDETWHENT